MTAARSGILYLAGNLLSAAVPFLLMPLLTRVLQPAEYGAIIAFFVLVAWCTPFAGISVHGALGVAWFQKPPAELPQFVGNAIVLAISSSALVALVVWGGLSLFPSIELGFGAGTASLAAIAAGANVLVQCRLVLWQSQQLPLANISLQVANSTLNMILSLIGVLLLGWAAQGRILGTVASALAMAVIAVALLRGSGLANFALRKSDTRELIAFGGPLIPHGLAGALLANADRFVVSIALGTAALGTYGAVAQLGSIMTIIADAFVKAFSPWLFARLQKGGSMEQLQAVGAMYAAVPAFLALGLIAWAGLFLLGNLLLGPQYRHAISLLPWFVLGGALSGVYLATSGLFFFRARTATLSAISFPIAIVGTAIMVFLVARLGMLGAAIGYALVQTLLAVGGWLVASRIFGLPFGRPVDALQAWWRTLPWAVPSR
jgi:O-antigen/teichoic acid export membrane protein